MSHKPVHTTPPTWVWKSIPPAGLKVVLTRFLERFVDSDRPNMITVIGFLFLLSNHIMGMLWCQGETGETCRLPPPFFLYFAFSVFFYQARKTGSSSALGELFDHGCDSLYMLLIVYPVVCSIGWTGTETFYVLCSAVTVFYASHWEEYHTNNLILGQFCNPTEGQVGCMLLFIFAYFEGPTWWVVNTLGTFLPFLPATIGSIPLRDAGLYALPFLLCYVIGDNAWSLYKWCKANKKQFSSTFSKLSPLLIHIAFMVGWVNVSKINIAETQFIYLMNFHGLMFSYLCDRLMIARITRQEVSGWNHILFLSLFGFANALFGFIPEVVVLPVLTWIVVAIFLYYVVSVTFQLSHYLDIFVFKLGRPVHK